MSKSNCSYTCILSVSGLLNGKAFSIYNWSITHVFLLFCNCFKGTCTCVMDNISQSLNLLHQIMRKALKFINDIVYLYQSYIICINPNGWAGFRRKSRNTHMPGNPPGFDPRTSRMPVGRPTDWANLSTWPWLSVLSHGYAADRAAAAHARAHAPSLRVGLHRVEDR